MPITDSPSISSPVNGRPKATKAAEKNGAGFVRLRRQPSKNSSSEALEFLTQCRPFCRLPQSEIESLARFCRLASVDRGQYISSEGDEESGGFIVVSGRLAMMKTSLSGKELVVELLAPGDILGLLLTLQKQPAQLSARAQSKSKVLWVPIANFLTVLLAHPEIYREFAAQLLECLQSSYRMARGLAHDRAEVRIAAILVNLALKFARAGGREKSPVVDITRQQIADLTGTTPETAIRVTRAMKSRGLLDIARPGVIEVLNLAALQQLAEE